MHGLVSLPASKSKDLIGKVGIVAMNFPRVDTDDGPYRKINALQ